MSSDDYLLALQLQEFGGLHDGAFQTNREIYEDDKENRRQNKSGKSLAKPQSLVDPSWETIDPTPDIHALFLQFNQTFFWDKLNAVEVRWSPRMTLCAGVCVYQGRGGLCSIRLSLPLLKLRPRKDLVETLLHEMIHAYLFVTHNNRDRDGHGPEFHKHMYRINDQAGTKITVYHSFHDEVKSYQQHWWRCNGPCQSRPPFFGMVRRSMNRAPGPTDNWYPQHQATCGGSFIKVREPEGYNKKGKKDKALPSTSKGSLTNYFPSLNKKPDCPSSGAPKNVVGFGDLKKSTPSSCSNPSASTFNPRSSSTVNNVVGFKDLNGGSQPPKKNHSGDWTGQGKKLGGGHGAGGRPGATARPGGGVGRSGGGVGRSGGSVGRSGGGVGRPDSGVGKPGGGIGRPGGGFGGGMLGNKGGGTLVVTGKGKNQGTDRPLTDLATFVPFAGSGHVLGTKANSTGVGSSNSFRPQNSTNVKSPDTQANLSRWLPNSDSRKRPSNSVPSADSKATRTSESNPNRSTEVIRLSDDEEPEGPKHAMVRCPLCYIEVSEIDVNIHLDECLSRQSNSNEVAQENANVTEACPICDRRVVSSELQSHVNSCIGDNFDPDDHEDALWANHTSGNTSRSSVETDDTSANTSRSSVESDVSELVSEVSPDADVSRGSSRGGSDQEKCPVCRKNVPSRELNDHLEQCDGLQCSQDSIILDESSDEEEDAAVGASPPKGPSGGRMYPCPLCTKLFEEDNMSEHIDVCSAG